MTLKSLRKQKCKPCRKGSWPIPRNQARERAARLPGWKLAASARSLSKTFVMKNFSAAIALINKILPVAEAEDHHPDLHLTNYRQLRIALSTHAVGGLSNNDFILAAKIEALPKTLKAV
jgi:4a-hydroxytetrahydrobiopterin dehydratase